MSNYKLVVRGVMQGRSVDDVAIALARMSNKPPEILRSLLNGRGMVVKHTPEMQKAVRYKKALERVGCVCTIEADITPAIPASSVLAEEIPSISVNVTSSLVAAFSPNDARQFEYASYPMGARMRAIASMLRLKEWIIVGAFVSVVFYYGSKIM